MHGGFYYRFDSTYLLLIPALLISFWAQAKVNSAYNKYKQIRTLNGYSGQHIARMILDAAGLFDIPIEIVNSKLGDHYDPSARILRLSPDVFNGTSIASAGIAAHECGHAIQHQQSYSPLKIRNSIYPVVNFGSSCSWILFIAGLILSLKPLVYLGIIMFSAVVLFQIITLPVEFNASSRALKILDSKGILYGDELKGAKKVLQAAAMTYVAATIMAVSQLIRLIAISNRND